MFNRDVDYSNRRTGLQLMHVAGFTFRPALIPTLVFVVLLGLLLALGGWQIERAEMKQSLIAARASGVEQSAVNLNWQWEISAADRYRPATVKGMFDRRHQWLQDNRIFRGQAGYHVYSLFLPEGGAKPALLVNRGWVPTGPDRTALPDLPLPEGEVLLHGHLDKPASVGIAMGDMSYPQDTAVSVHPYLEVSGLAVEMGRPLLPLVLVLDEGEPGVLLRDWSPSMPMGPEKHLGYALQWFSLAFALVIIFIGVNAKRIEKQEDV